MNPRILIIDDEAGTRFGFSRYLSRVGYAVSEAACLSEAQEVLSSQRFDAILLDMMLPDGNGLDWIPLAREQYPDLPIIMITGVGDVPLAVEAMRRGADNFLTKPVDMPSLEVFLRKTVEIGSVRRKQSAEQRLVKKEKIYFGASAAMAQVQELASLAAENDSTVLIASETGTGKGMLARWIHDHSSRSAQSFVEINCSGLRGELLASELFGNIRGAFTTAVRDRQGLLEVADRGTLFLDEIGDMDVAVQTQFLKVIEEKSFRRIGDVKMRKSDFRLICATNRDLPRCIQEGNFRSDLYFRIHVFPIAIPSLSEVPEDIPGLVRHILDTLGSAVELAPQIMGLLQRYEWPGNIRELRNVLERALLLARGRLPAAEHFPGIGQGPPLSSRAAPIAFPGKQEDAVLLSTLKRFNGNIPEAASALGMSRATFYRRLKKIRESNEG